jgi:hypothetical protein
MDSATAITVSSPMEIGQGERPHRMGAALDHALVDVLGRGEPRLEHADGGEQIRDQQGVDHEPGPVLRADLVLASWLGANGAASSMTAGDVSSDGTSSTSRSTGTRLKKWMPITARAGRSPSPAS